jgi:hypothetical protein
MARRYGAVLISSGSQSESEHVFSCGRKRSFIELWDRLRLSILIKCCLQCRDYYQGKSAEIVTTAAIRDSRQARERGSVSFQVGGEQLDVFSFPGAAVINRVRPACGGKIPRYRTRCALCNIDAMEPETNHARAFLPSYRNHYQGTCVALPVTSASEAGTLRRMWLHKDVEAPDFAIAPALAVIWWMTMLNSLLPIDLCI